MDEFNQHSWSKIPPRQAAQKSAEATASHDSSANNDPQISSNSEAQVRPESKHITRKAQTCEWSPLHTTSSTDQTIFVRQGLDLPSPAAATAIANRGSMDMNCNPISSTPELRLLSSKCTLGWRVGVPDQGHVDGSRDLDLVLQAGRSERGLYVPHRREDEPVILRGASVADGDVAEPDAGRVDLHAPLHLRVRASGLESQGLEVRVGDAVNEDQRGKKLLRTRKRGTNNSLHINPDLREKENNGSSATGQQNPIFDEAAISNHRNAHQNAEPISSRKAAVMPSPSNAVAADHRRTLDLGKTVVDDGNQSTCGSSERYENIGNCCTSDTSNRRRLDLHRSEAAARSEKLTRTDLGFDEDGSASNSQQQPPSSAAVACVCRDTFGRIINGFTKSIEAKSAELAEAQALIETLDFVSSNIAPKRSEREIIIHSDCSTLVAAILSSDTLNWEIQPLVDRAKHKLKESSGITLAHCNRDTNKVADWLAKAQRIGYPLSNWVNNPPSALLDLLYVDATMVCTKNSSY